MKQAWTNLGVKRSHGPLQQQRNASFILHRRTHTHTHTKRTRMSTHRSRRKAGNKGKTTQGTRVYLEVVMSEAAVRAQQRHHRAYTITHKSIDWNLRQGSKGHAARASKGKRDGPSLIACTPISHIPSNRLILHQATISTTQLSTERHEITSWRKLANTATARQK